MRKILALLVFLFIALHALATDLTVTSNADSGPGTLRQALIDAAANGSATQDRIIFNIADQSEAGRTITILSKLPAVSSNLVIDGTTQPGSAIGSTNAKITITEIGAYTGQPDTGGFTGQNVQDLEFYGIYFKIFFNGQRYATPIYLRNAKNIIIGKAGKGNVFGQIEVDIDLYSCTGISISGNLFGRDPVTGQALGYAFNNGPRMYMCSDITFGGATPADGNTITARYYGLLITGVDPYTGSVAVHGKYCYIRNNQFGIDDAANNYFGGIEEGNFISDLDEVKVNDNNFIVNHNFQLKNITGSSIIKNNVFKYTEILLESSTNVTIGGASASDANIITYAHGSGIYATSCSNVLIRHNSIYCAADGTVYTAVTPAAPLTPITVTSITNGVMTGKSSPNAVIEVFSDGECKKCDAKTFEGTTIADGSGNWTLAASAGIGLTASASVNSTTSLFLRVSLDQRNVIVTNASCGNNGSIKGAVVTDGLQVQWTDEQNNIVATTADATNLKPGLYHLAAYMGQCSVQGSTYQVKDGKPAIAAFALQVKNVSCGTSNGSVSGLYIVNQSDFTVKSIQWLDRSNQVVGNALNLQNVPAGKYTLEVTNTDGCTGTYGPITLINATGPQITQTSAIITGSNCGESKGSIIGITATGSGTLTYTWKNAQGFQVANTADLINQPSGNYTLQVDDNSACGPVYSSVITIPQLNGVSISEGTAVATPAVCGGNGSIDGFVVTGASSSVVYRWYDQQDHLKGTTREPSFSTPSPGSYYMVASDGACSARSTLYTIGQQSNTTDYARYLNPTITDATCGNNDGAITVNIGAPANADVKAYRWVTKTGAVTLSSTTNRVSNLDAGVYQLYITGNNNCEKLVTEFTVDRLAGLTITTDRLQVRDDICNQGLGSITGLSVTQVSGKPATCKWTDATGVVVGTTPDLLNRHAGTYTLNVSDGTICGKTLIYTISNNFTALGAPLVNDIQLCSAGDALLNVSGAIAGRSYRLYDSPNSINPVDVQASGKFKITVTGNRSYYVSQFVGDCESSRAEVKVILGGLSALKLPNAISPNGDGINDTWKIPGIESYPTADVQIFTRSGQKVYASVGYATPFNGTLDGKPLAAGTYYYIINLNTGCSLVSGNLIIIR